MNKRRLVITTLGIVLIFMAGVAALRAAKRHVEAVNCSNQMHSILCAASLLWPDEHDGHLPSDFVSMSNELATTKILICPADHARRPAASWPSFSSEHCSYEMVTPGLRKATPIPSSYVAGFTATPAILTTGCSMPPAG